MVQTVLICLILGAVPATYCAAVGAQTTSKLLNGCLTPVEAHAKFPLGAIRKNCDFPVNFVYCLADINSDAIITTKRCGGALQIQGIAPGATVAAETDRGSVYYYACKSPDVPQEQKFITGVGIGAFCSATPSYVYKVMPESTVQGRAAGARAGAIGVTNPAPNNYDKSGLNIIPSSLLPIGARRVTVVTANKCNVLVLPGKNYGGNGWVRGIRSLFWDGSCRNGFAEGEGALYTQRYADPPITKLVGKMFQGVFDGPVSTLGTDNSKPEITLTELDSFKELQWGSMEGIMEVRLGCQTKNTDVCLPGRVR